METATLKHYGTMICCCATFANNVWKFLGWKSSLEMVLFYLYILSSELCFAVPESWMCHRLSPPLSLAYTCPHALSLTLSHTLSLYPNIRQPYYRGWPPFSPHVTSSSIFGPRTLSRADFCMAQLTTAHSCKGVVHILYDLINTSALSFDHVQTVCVCVCVVGCLCALLWPFGKEADVLQ